MRGQRFSKSGQRKSLAGEGNPTSKGSNNKYLLQKWIFLSIFNVYNYYLNLLNIWRKQETWIIRMLCFMLKDLTDEDLAATKKKKKI